MDENGPEPPGLDALFPLGQWFRIRSGNAPQGTRITTVNDEQVQCAGLFNSGGSPLRLGARGTAPLRQAPTQEPLRP